MARIDPATLDGLHPRRRTSWRTIWGDIVAVASIVVGGVLLLGDFDDAVLRHHRWLVWVAVLALAIVLMGSLGRVVRRLKRQERR